MQLLYDTFSAFGVIVNTPKIMRDPESGASKGFGFISFDGFEASGKGCGVGGSGTPGGRGGVRCAVRHTGVCQDPAP